MIHIFQGIACFRDLKIAEEEVNKRKVDFKWKKKDIRKMIIFDLDETLAHLVRPNHNSDRKPDVQLKICTPAGREIEKGFNIRPFTKEILEMCNKHFEVVVFTASHQCYADRVIDYIDPTGELIQHRFYRPHCVHIEEYNIFVKDLRIFANVPLKDILIVDNAVYSFGAQLDNGIPITPFKEDDDDRQFLHLIEYLERCESSDDMREYNSQFFKLD
jgi:CTD small phosphatase-like protein 2